MESDDEPTRPGMSGIRVPIVVSHDQWLNARLQLLGEEKHVMRLRDELSLKRRALPWEEVEKSYVFAGANGRESLAQLFAGHSQLIVYHFMFAPEWQAGCKACSFWADSFNGSDVHLARRDVSFVAISRAPLYKLLAYRKRMGWQFKWVSSGNSDFNYDYGVSFHREDIESGRTNWNYRPQSPENSDVTGISVFFKNAHGRLFHSYSCFQRGIDMMNAAYQYLDLTPKGRDELSDRPTMDWVRRRDEYAG